MPYRIRKSFGKPLVALLLVALLSSICQAKTVVVFVGGWATTPEQMESLSRAVPEEQKARYFLPSGFFDLIRPWYCAELLYEYIRKNLSDDDLIFVSFSLGGNVTQRMLNDHPEMPVKKLILIAAPIGGYRVPVPYLFFSADFPKSLPVYVIAGSKSEDSFHLRGVNDGSVDVQSAFAIPDDNLRDGTIFPAGHLELHKLPQVQTQLSQWLGPAIESQKDRLAHRIIFH
jgi:pimeloyl-ACP methyl ester carboxylesterase